MKVITAGSYLLQSIVIWLLTNIIGSTVLWMIVAREFGLLEIIGLSLLLSIPAVILLIPALYILEFIYEPRKRITFAILSTLAICAVVLMIFLFFIPTGVTPTIQIGEFLLPYITAAPISFILVAEITMIRRIASKRKEFRKIKTFN